MQFEMGEHCIGDDEIRVHRGNTKDTLVHRSCKFALSHMYMYAYISGHNSRQETRDLRRAKCALRKSRRHNRMIIARFCVTVMIYCLLMCAYTWVRFNLYAECNQPRPLSRRFVTMRLLTLMCACSQRHSCLLSDLITM